MLYHDPELCAFLDTKKISPDSYAHFWVGLFGTLFFSVEDCIFIIEVYFFKQFRGLFASKASVKVTLTIWDMYFQLGDQFLIFFMSLILVFNGREETMSSNEIEKCELISKTKMHFT